MPAEFDSSSDLIGALQRDLTDRPAFSIGIDGIDGAGKTTLGRAVASAFGIPLISLDDFLIKDRETYVEHLRMADIAEQVRVERFVVEGVCVLEVAERLGLTLTCLVYVKRIGPYGDWRDEEECDPQEPIDQLIARLGEEAKAFATFAPSLSGGDRTDDGEVPLSPFRKEVIAYHSRYQPSQTANYELHVFTDGRLPSDAYLPH